MSRTSTFHASQPHWRVPGLRLLLGLIALLGSAPVFSAQFCVGTPAELGNALATAAFTPASNEIRMRSGTWDLPQGLVYQNLIGGDLTISGGWNAGCTSFNPDPYATVVQGSAWNIYVNQFDARILRLRFSGLPFVRFYDWGGNCEPVGQRFRVGYSVFDGAHTTQTRLFFASDCHEVEVENVLVIGGHTGIQRTASDEADTPPRIRIAHTTVLSAQTNGIVFLHLDSDDPGYAELFNTVIHGSGQSDLILVRAHALALNNHFTTISILSGSSLLPGSSGNQGGNPQLQSNGRPLEPNSPVINTGSPWLPGGVPSVDLSGAPRVVGSAPDRGAFESAIDDLGVIAVTNANDSGAGSLRQAILSANASPGPQVITFNIPGTCPATIFLQSPLPPITDSGLLFINGWTQPGSSNNSLIHGNNGQICIRLRRDPSVASVTHALRVPALSNALLFVQGVGFGGFSVAALELLGGQYHILHGNRIGGNGLFGALPGNGIGVRIGPGASKVQVGGSQPGNRNFIGGNGVMGILVDGATDTEIVNNYIGTNGNGSAAVGNGIGIGVLFGAVGNRISDNVISGNTNEGVLVSGAISQDNVLVGNRIGVKRVDAVGDEALGNGGTGVRINGSAHDNRIGGPGRGAGNRIGYNGNKGIWIESGRGNRVSSNEILDNTGLGIDLAEQGVNPNNDDSGPLPIDYANRGLNFPVLSAAGGGAQTGVVTGSLTTTPGTYRIEFFAVGGSGTARDCDLSGHGEADRPIGHWIVTIPVPTIGPPQATVTFIAPVASAINLLGTVITATATDASGNTSELSACRGYQNDVIFANGFE